MALTDLNDNLLFAEDDEKATLLEPQASSSPKAVHKWTDGNGNGIYCNGSAALIDQLDDNEKSSLKSTTSYENSSSNKFQLEPKVEKFQAEVVWVKATFLMVIHILALYGIGYAHKAKLATFFFSFAIGILSGIGVQCGAHRLWSHRSYKASLGLRIFLAVCQTMAGQKDIYYWVRDHRVHHKYSETDADPHNSNRGFWFAHMGWIYLRKHPEVLAKGAQLNMSDIEADSVVMFQQKYYIPLVLLFWGIIPAAIPVILWDEQLWLSILGCVFFRHVYLLNVTGLVNSYAHIFGYRPYDARIAPAESKVVRHLMMGEGFHNFHHVFPWDYSASELGSLDVFNPATAFIDFAHKMGWAWDLRKPTPAMVARRMETVGDPKVAKEPYRTTPLCEWAAGFAMVFAPWFAIRWILMTVLG